MSKIVLVIVYWVFVMLGSLIRMENRRRGKGTRIAVDRKSGMDLFLMSLPSLGMLLIPLVYTFTPWLNFADYALPAWAGWVGGLLFALAVWLIYRSHADLGLNWSVTLQIREEHTLVTNGVYHLIRHPMYAGHWLWGLAQALLLQNWIAGLATLATLLPMYLVRVPQEEQMMLDQFGEQYRRYMQRTGRVIPRLLKAGSRG